MMKRIYFSSNNKLNYNTLFFEITVWWVYLLILPLIVRSYFRCSLTNSVCLTTFIGFFGASNNREWRPVTCYLFSVANHWWRPSDTDGEWRRVLSTVWGNRLPIRRRHSAVAYRGLDDKAKRTAGKFKAKRPRVQ